MTFDEFDLDPRCVRALHDQGITTPTPVQAAAIPPALEGKDLIALAQTGTGKTLAYTLPGLTRIARGKIGPNLMLVLTPTRELTVQVHEVIRDIGKALHIRAASVYGGVGMKPQVEALRRGCAVIAATPGRLLDHLERKTARFDNLLLLVLDEADRMLDMGFLPDITRIVERLPKDRQTIMCSATFPAEIDRLAQRWLRDPVRISVGPIHQPVDTVRQIIYPVFPDKKMEVFYKILEEEKISSGLIFLRTKERTDLIARSLKRHGYKAAAIHGDRSQAERQQALDGFRAGRYKILVATDVAARGLDIEGVSHVINYDIPPNADDYLHRIGRTARASAKGDAITLVCPAEHEALAAIEKAIGRNLPRAEFEGAAPVLSTWAPAEDGEKRRPKKKTRAVRGLLRRRR